MGTYQVYHFKLSQSSCAESSIAWERTQDIGDPIVSITQYEPNKAKLTWNDTSANNNYVQVWSYQYGEWGIWQADPPNWENGNHIYEDPWEISPGTVRIYRIWVIRNGREKFSNTVIGYFPNDLNLGNSYCNMSVGGPVNVSNGNMYLTQQDYGLPGLGESINISRTYNSQNQIDGLFGLGWTTSIEERITVPNQDDNNLVRLMLPDARPVYFIRPNSAHPFVSASSDFYGNLVKNLNGSYTLTFKEGNVHQFDASGKLLSMTDRNANQTTLNYDVNGFLTGITDASGRTLTILLNPNGTVDSISDSISTVATYTYFPNTTKLQEVTYQDGSKYKFEYTTINNKTYLTTVKDAFDKILETHQYDSSGRATTSEKQGGVEKYTLDYSNPTFTQVTDALGRITKYYYKTDKSRNYLAKMEGNCNCGGGTELSEFEYDGNLNVKKKKIFTSPNNWLETNYTYNNQGDMLSMTDIWGTVEVTYNQFGQPLTMKDRMNGVWTMTFDSNGNIKTITNPLDETTTLNYPTTNNKGLPDSIVNARQKTTKYKWYASGLLQEIEDANLKKTTYTYDARSRIKTVTNALQHQTQYNYFDDTQRKVEMIYPNADKITYKYDIRRLLQSITDERGKITNYEFDDAYRLKKITDPLGHFKEFGYDLMSNLTTYKDGLGNITDYKYDDFDRLREIEYPPEITGATRLKVNYSYDDIGRIKTFSDTAGRITTYNYLDAERKNEIINAENEKTTIEYNQRFQMIKVTDANNQVYDFTHDPLGRMLSQTRAGATQSYEYDEVGNQTKRTDYLGRVTEYVYDNLNRLEQTKYLSASVVSYQSTFTYDDISRLKTAVNEAGTVSFNYDNRNRITSSTDVHGQTVSYEYIYDATINKQNLKLNGNLHTVYNFDDANRLTSLTDSTDNTTITFGYDNADRLTTKSLPNGINTVYTYDGMSRLTRMQDTSSTATLFDRQYGYNSANQISQIVEPSLTRTFSYDNVDRLTGVTASNSANESYTFDDVGNRTSSHLSNTYSYQPYNKLTSTQTGNYGYNANGNTIKKAEGKDLWRYNFDHENRLTFAKNRRERVNYQYDALGRRVKTSNFLKGSTKYTYDGLDVVQDNDSVTGITKYQNGLGIDNKLKLKNGSNSSYFLADHLGSTNGLTNSSGSLTSSASYDSFGNPTGNLATRYQFTGREKDDVTGLYYYRARFYDSKLGRFISEDPIGFAGGDVNLYGYVGNNPILYNDPFGFERYSSSFYTKSYEEWSNYHKIPPSNYTYGCNNSGIGLGGMFDFWNNYQDMRMSNTIGADKFFHCMANCQSSRRGSIGDLVASIISEGREQFDENIKGDSRKVCDEDRFANDTGRYGGRKCQPCEQVCSQFRPKSLVYPVHYPPTKNHGKYGDCMKFGNWMCK